MDVRLTALNRFGLGARIGEVDRLADPRGWLRAQLNADPTAGLGRAEPYSLEDAAEALVRLRTAARSGDQSEAAAARREIREMATTEMAAVLRHRLSTETPFVERLVAFWSNHLCVSIAKPQVTAFAGHYERAAIRPHVLGRFEEMVLASARHPAMLLYLDNVLSVGPRSAAGTRTARRGNARGLNENYARELLELHTVGVDGGYDQQDVEALARILTGWSVETAGPPPGAAGRQTQRRAGAMLEGVTFDEAPGFVFRPGIHEPGSKTVLGVRYREGGVREGEDVIRDLCRHPATATFVSGKIVRHFVGDDPPPEAIEEVESVFLESEGDLRAVAEALIDLEAAWAPGAGKFRTPQEWLVAALRAFQVDEVPEAAAGVLRQLRHTPWSPPSPKGFPDGASEWADPDALMNRAELARSLARRFAGGGPDRGRRPLDPTVVATVVDAPADDPMHELLADTSIPADERLALALAGPAFQWR